MKILAPNGGRIARCSFRPRTLFSASNPSISGIMMSSQIRSEASPAPRAAYGIHRFTAGYGTVDRAVRFEDSLE